MNIPTFSLFLYTFNSAALLVDFCVLLQAFTNPLRVEEGGGAFVTEEHLLVQDRDSREEALRVEVRRMAGRGRLELQGRALQQGDGFSLQDLRGLRLRSDPAGRRASAFTPIGLVQGVGTCDRY